MVIITKFGNREVEINELNNKAIFGDVEENICFFFDSDKADYHAQDRMVFFTVEEAKQIRDFLDVQIKKSESNSK